MKKPKLSTVKTATRLVARQSVAFCIAATVTSVVPVETKTDKVKVFIGANVIAQLVASRASDFVAGEFDSFVEAFRDAKALIQKTKESEETTQAEAPN